FSRASEGDHPASPALPARRSSDLRALSASRRLRQRLLQLRVHVGRGERQALADRGEHADLPVAQRIVHLDQPELVVLLVPHELGDRKSTRLNSSHVKSSYAVYRLQ